jgi:hypothetical protein
MENSYVHGSFVQGYSYANWFRLRSCYMLAVTGYLVYLVGFDLYQMTESKDES